MAYQSEIELRVKVLDKELKDLERQIDKVQSRAKSVNPFGASGASKENKKALDLQQRLMAAEKARLSVDKNRLQLNLDLNQQRIKSINLNTSWYKALQTGKQIQLDINKAVAKEAALRKQATAKRRSRLGEDLALGVGFPLLFGGGAGSVIGGAAGALAGGGKGGFGLQILGSAIGQQVDAVVQKIAELGKGLNPLTFDLEAVSTAAGIAGTETAQFLEKIEQYGSATEAARLATALLESKVGKDGVKALTDFGKSAQSLGNSLSSIFTKVLSNIAKIAGPLLGKLAQMAGDAETRQVFQSAEGLTGVEASVQEFFASGRTQGGAGKRRASKLRSELTAAGIEVGAGPAGLKAAAEKIRMEAGQRLQAAPGLEIAEVAAGIQTPEQERAQSKAEAEARKIGQLTDKVGLQERLLVLDRQIAEAVRKEDDALKSVLEKEVVKEKLANKINNIRQSDASEAVKAVQIRLAEAEAARKVQDIDLEASQAKADQVKNAQATIDSLYAEQNILQATLDGRLEEEQITQRIQQLKKENPELSEEELRKILEGNEALREKIKLQQESEARYKQLATTIQNGVVDGIMSALDGTKSLAESLSGVLKQLAKMFISAGVGSFNIGGKGGSGLLGLFPGFANGGRPPVGRPSIVGERGPELFVPRSSGTIVPNHALGGSANVTVNVDASGSSVEGNADQAGRLGKAIGIAVQQELIKQKRPGGLLGV